MTKTTETARTFSKTTEATAAICRPTTGAAATGLSSQWPQSSQLSSQEASQSSQLSRLLALAMVVVAVLFTGNVFASTGYFTEESLKTADMTGISEGIERTLKAFDGRVSRAKALARKLSGVEADMVAARLVAAVLEAAD